MYSRETIKCTCGEYDTGLNKNGFFRIIPPEGLKCPCCGATIIPGQLPPNIPKPKPEKDNLPDWPKKPKIPDYPKPWRKPWFDERDRYRWNEDKSLINQGI